jgi:thiol-disulfide isomerase/thioredoxin
MTRDRGRSGISLVTYLIVAAFAATLGFGLHYLWNRIEDRTAPNPTFNEKSASTTIVGQQRPEFTLPDLNGQSFSIDRWDGKVILINFWATWCPPCRKEIPTFIQALEKYGDRGFQIVGIAIDEPKLVAEFVQDLGANYPQLIASTQSSELSKRYGNHYGALPYSILIDRKSTIRFTKAGELSRDELESLIENLI